MLIWQHLEENLEREYKPPYQRQWERAIASAPATQSSYAVVNREWQAHFEAETFRYLTIDAVDIPEIGEYVTRRGRGPLVRCIWLRVVLPTYGCDKCDKKETEEEEWKHEEMLTYALWTLFYKMSGFQRGRHPLVLELSVYSPSDAEHYCKELKNTMNDSS